MTILMQEYTVYILRCRDKSYYTGITSSLEKRLLEHQRGDDPRSYTNKRRPVTLVYSHSFRNVGDAIAAEKQIQGWSRKKKEALIAGNIPLLHALAMSREKQERLQKERRCSEGTWLCASSPPVLSEAAEQPSRRAQHDARF